MVKNLLAIVIVAANYFRYSQELYPSIIPKDTHKER